MSHLHSSDSAQITIRMATDADRPAIARIADRDSAPAPREPVLIATVGSDVRAAMSLTDGAVAADPFHRTAELVEMLRIRRQAAAPARVRSARTAVRRHRPRLAFRTTA